jgi:soluble lytic murein transglycosylase-like protein
MDDRNPRRARARLLTTAALVTLSCAAIRPAAASDRWQPSPAQLEQLAAVEPYVDYFTSLTYGPDRVQVPEEFIRALILMESGADPNATSPRGARGLTQILPATAKRALVELTDVYNDFEFVDEAAFDRFTAEDLHDPALNLLIACHVTANYYAMYEGRTDLVVSAWNAGPGAVERYGNRPPPFPETRKLIERVKRTMSYLDGVQVNYIFRAERRRAAAAV